MVRVGIKHDVLSRWLQHLVEDTRTFLTCLGHIFFNTWNVHFVDTNGRLVVLYKYFLSFSFLSLSTKRSKFKKRKLQSTESESLWQVEMSEAWKRCVLIWSKDPKPISLLWKDLSVFQPRHCALPAGRHLVVRDQRHGHVMKWGSTNVWLISRVPQKSSSKLYPFQKYIYSLNRSPFKNWVHWFAHSPLLHQI